MLVALRATNRAGRPSDEGHSLAHQIGRAGSQLPKPVPDEPEEWSVWGERRLVRELPTHLERIQSPFTKAGLRYIRRLEEKYFENGAHDDAREIYDDNDDQIRIGYLEEQLADAPERIAELEEMVETLSLQLTSIIG